MTHPDPPNGPQDNPWQSGQPSPESSEESSATGQPQEHRPNEAEQPTQINPAVRPDQPQPDQPQPDQPQPEQPQPEQQPDQGQFGHAQDEPTQDLSAQGGQPPAGQWQQPGPEASQWQTGQQQPGQQPWQGQSQPSANQPGQWQGQPPAGQWHGQSSANQWQTAEGGQSAHSQPSAGQQPPAGQQAHQPGYPQSQGSGSFAGQPQYPGAQPQTQPTYPGWQQPQKDDIADANPLRAAFDFSFSRYATPGLVKIIYILAVIFAALWWLGGTLITFIAAIAGSAYSGSSGGGIVLGFVFLLLGWIPALLEVLFVRVVLEAVMALVRVAEDARGIRTKIDE